VSLLISPAQQAQLQRSDILMQLADQSVNDLASYAAILRTLKPDEKVELHFQCAEEINKVEVTLIER